jgi:glycosyltransferase involved in cell wall biosynthesis
VRSAINLVGYLDAVLGQGESARRFCDGLDAAGVPWAGFGLRLPVAEIGGSRSTRFGTAPFPHRVTVLWCNPDRYGVDITVDEPLTKGRYTIGRWAWEIDEVPYSWRFAARWLDEIWVISDFVADRLRASVGAPVVVLPLPIGADPLVGSLDRARFGIADDTFMFLFTFDYHSTLARKNPVAVIAAYRCAFGPGDGAALLIKSVNAASCPSDRAALALAVEGRDDIRLVDAALSARDKDALLAGCDCYVSLHRSEGFGIAMAEAIAYERPVIATGYGGNLEYMSGRDALLVSHRPVAVGDGAGPYAAAATWAEPDVAHAAALMRQLAADPDAAAERGRRAAKRLAVRFSPAAAGAVAAREIERAHAALAQRDAAATLAGGKATWPAP